MDHSKTLVLAGMLLQLAAGQVFPGEVSFDVGGLGQLKLISAKERARVPQGAEVQPWPSGIIDRERTHYLSSGSLTSILLCVANPEAIEMSQGKLVLELPPGVEIELGSNYVNLKARTEETIERDGKLFKKYTIPCTTHPTSIYQGIGPGDMYFNRNRPPVVWVRTDLPEGAEPGRLYMKYLYQTKNDPQFIEGPETSVNLKISAPLQGKQPTLVQSGVMGRFNINTGTNDKSEPLMTEKKLGNYFRQLGYNYVLTPLQIPRETGVYQWKECVLQNVFEVHLDTEIPEELQFVLKGKKLEKVLTPSAIYGGEPWVKEHILGPLADQINTDNVQSLWVNLEPYDYTTLGCQSEKNRDEFIKYAKLPADEVKAAWPDGIAQKYLKPWREFRNWQVEQIVRTLIEVIDSKGAQLNTKPFLSFGISKSRMFPSPGDDPVSTVDWGDLPICQQTWSYRETPYTNNPEHVGAHLGAAQIMQSALLAIHYPAALPSNHKMVLGCLYGWDQTGRGTGFYYPEQLEVLHASTALFGLANVQNYAAWPVWDGRYASAISKANDRIARWEPFTVKGRMQRKHTFHPKSYYFPQKVADTVTPAEQEIVRDFDKPAHLFTTEYEKDGRRLIVVANTWIYGDCYYSLRLTDLDPKEKYVVLEPEANRIFTPTESRKSWTAEELTNGVLLHTGSVRISCFLIEKYDEAGNYGTVYAMDDVQRKAKGRRVLPPNPY